MNKYIHTYNRFGFGLSQEELEEVSKGSLDSMLKRKRLLLTSLDLEEFINNERKDKKALRKLASRKMNELRKVHFSAMMDAKNFIHEKMVLFWHHHFACEIKNPIYAIQFSNTIRKHAIGDFRKLLHGISRSAAMIAYLNNRQNKKTKPNENFARELCELFTLGRDVSYTENDIKEIARAFTGWRFRMNGEFFVNQKHFDQGRKEIFGRSGNFDGNDVIEMILEKKECAYFIMRNFYEYFINPKIDDSRVEELANYFYRHDYKIDPLIRYVINSDWFYAPENVMVKIKSPIELIVGIGRQVALKNEDEKAWLKLQKIFDQTLYKPRNVEGWKVNQEWIDSNSLPMRMRLASILLNNGQFEIKPKHDYDENPNFKAKKTISQKLDFQYDWNVFLKKNMNADFKLLYFNNLLSHQAQSYLKTKKMDSQKEEVVQLMSLPEFQLS